MATATVILDMVMLITILALPCAAGGFMRANTVMRATPRQGLPVSRMPASSFPSGQHSFGAPLLGSATPWERNPSVVRPLLDQAIPSFLGERRISMASKSSLIDAAPELAEAHLDICPGDDNAKCDYDHDHRICAQFLDTEGKPLHWGGLGSGESSSGNFQNLMPNGGTSKCINMTTTAELVHIVGCENVHISCDATDLSFVSARNWWAYGRWGLSLEPAVDCLMKTCSLEARQATEGSGDAVRELENLRKATGVSATSSYGMPGWGPSSEASLDNPADALTGQADKTLALAYEQCEEVTKTYSKTFYIGTALMEPAERKHAWAIYAWCRRTDDIVDSPTAMLNPSVLDSDLEEWTSRLDGIWNQKPADMFDLAMADTVRAYPDLDIQPFRDMIEGMIMDVPGHPKGKGMPEARYQTFDEMYLYCYRVAGTVGLMMLPIFGTADGYTQQDAAVPAEALGIAFQLTNILRDVGEDLKRGRIYLPMDELKQFGLTEEDLVAHKVTEKYKAFMKFQIARARKYYAEAERGIPMLAPNARFAVRASLDLYGRILDKIEANGYDNLNKRAYTTGWEKLGILPGSFFKSMQKFDGVSSSNLAATPSPVSLASDQEEALWSKSSAGIAVAGVAMCAALAVVAARMQRRKSPALAEMALG